MAINATFKADFSSFLAAIDKAEVALVDMSKGANKVESSLNRMVDSFSGRKLIQEASLMTIAVEKAGGIAKLTSKELERVGTVANEAADKMKRLGLEVPAGLQKLADETKKANVAGESMGAWLGKANSLLGIFGAGLSVGAVIAFGKAILADADALTKLHDRTGISVELIQAMRTAGDDAGVTIEQMADAINKLQMRLGTGDAGANRALRELGINIETFKRLDAGEQFIRLSDALRDVKDPLDFARIASELFGKTWAELSPVLKRGFDDVKNGAGGMSRETIKALDDAGDAAGRLWRSVKANLGEALADILTLSLSKTRELRSEFQKMADDAERNKPKIEGGLAPPGLPADLDAIEKGLTSVVTASIKQHEAAEKAAKEAEARQAALSKSTTALTSSTLGFVTSWGMIAGQLPRGTAAIAEASHEFDVLEVSVHEFNMGVFLTDKTVSQFVTGSLTKMPNVTAQATRAIQDANEAASQSTSIFGALGNQFKGFLNGITGGNGLAGAFANLGKGFIDGLGKLLSGGITSLISSGIGLAVKGIGSLFSKIFGGDKELKQVKDMRDQFIAASGGLAQLQKQATAANFSLTTLLNTKKVADFNAAVKQLQQAFNDQQQDVEDLNKAIEKYGFSIEELGPAMQKQKLDDQAKELINDWRLLVGSGIDLTLVNEKMASTINDYLKMAKKTGIEVPVAMKPILQSMIDQGLLIDENGNLITDLGDTGVKFSETMTEGFDRIVKKLDELLATLGKVPGAINSIPQPPPIHVPIVYDYPDQPNPNENFVASGGLVTASGIVQTPDYFARGGNVIAFRPRGTDTVPAMLTPGEIVLSRREAAAYRAGGGMDTSRIEKKLDELNKHLRNQNRRAPEQVRIAVAGR